MGQLQIGNPRKVHSDPVVVAVDLSGGVEGRHYPKLDQSLSGLRAKGVRHFVFDLSAVRFVNEPDQLAVRHRQFGDEGGGLALVQVPPKLRVLFGTLGLDKVIPVRGTIDEAVAALLSGPPDRRDLPERRIQPDRRRAPPPEEEPAEAKAERRGSEDRRAPDDRRVTRRTAAVAPRPGLLARLLAPFRRR